MGTKADNSLMGWLTYCWSLLDIRSVGPQEGPKLYGENLHFCKGKLISGPEVKSCVASFLMILIPSVLWHVKTGPFFADRYTVMIPILTAFCQVMSLTLLIFTAFSDPGIMPRAKDFSEIIDERTKASRQKPPPRYHDLVLRGHPFKIKYCTTCNIYRPPRCTHCSVCENCIERFDHHCPWIGNCIGKRNYWLFFSFVTTTGCLNVTVLCTAVIHLVVLTEEFKDKKGKGGGDAFVQSMQEEPLSVALAVYSAAIVWFTVGLCLYHSYLICTNQTTYEQIKGVYSSMGNNPFSRGLLGNCHDILCSRVRPRYFNAWDNRLIWNSTPSDEAAREWKINSRSAARGDKRYEASGDYAIRETAQAKNMVTVSNDPFLTQQAGQKVQEGGADQRKVPQDKGNSIL